MMTPTEHNDAQWLVVRQQEGHGRGHLHGWYVIRICPCHWGQAVTLPYETEERAIHARKVILGVAGSYGPRQEWPAKPPLPADVLPGQVWRRNRMRDHRYFQVINRPQKGVARVISVEPDGTGWRQAPEVQKGHGPPWSKIMVHRMLNPTCHYYTWVDDAANANELALEQMEREVCGDA